MNVILFGAGASFGQAGDKLPPLTSGLYDALKDKFRDSWGKVPENLAQLFRDPITFEHGITRLINDAFPNGIAIGSVEPEGRNLWRNLQWDMAKYFFEFEPAQDNLYVRFLNKLAPPRTLSLRVATLNYDRLLQSSARSLQIGFNYSGEPNLAEPLTLCLPHGTSYLASRATMKKNNGGYAIRGSGEINPMGAGLAIEGPLIELFTKEELDTRAKEDFFPPVMSYIDPQKLSASGNSFLAHQRKVWTDWVEQANKIAIIGVGVRNRNTPDAHVWDPLRKTRAPILYVSGDDAGRFLQWSTDCGRCGDKALRKSWEEGFDDIINFLKSQ